MLPQELSKLWTRTLDIKDEFFGRKDEIDQI